MEKITIQNFAGIKSMTLEIKAVNVLIGPQGSGKSVTVKLLYFFKSFFDEAVQSIISDETKAELIRQQKEKFLLFFPKESWHAGDFKIIYTTNKTEIFASKTGKKFEFGYSANLDKILNRERIRFGIEKSRLIIDPKFDIVSFRRESSDKIIELLNNEISSNLSFDQNFVPAGRSFFANFQKSIYSFINENRLMDPFLMVFGTLYENTKNLYTHTSSYRNISPNRDKKEDKAYDALIAQILSGKYQQEKEKDFLIHDDNRKVNLLFASSGQQETLPLIVILKVMKDFHFYGTTLYIEEPEAHLFPIAQKRIIQLLVRTFNELNPNFQVIVTTHSPYILSSLNNLMQAGKLAKEYPEKAKEIEKVVSVREQLNPDWVAAYSIANGKMKNLIEKESSLISPTILDGVSDEISIEFGKLLDIEF